MAILYSYPIAQPALDDLLLGTQTEVVNNEGNFTKSFYIADLINLVSNTTVSNATAVALNSATLNTLYPNAMIGFKVQCTNPAVLKIYEKTNTSTWISYSIVTV